MKARVILTKGRQSLMNMPLLTSPEALILSIDRDPQALVHTCDGLPVVGHHSLISAHRRDRAADVARTQGALELRLILRADRSVELCEPLAARASRFAHRVGAGLALVCQRIGRRAHLDLERAQIVLGFAPVPGA